MPLYRAREPYNPDFATIIVKPIRVDRVIMFIAECERPSLFVGGQDTPEKAVALLVQLAADRGYSPYEESYNIFQVLPEGGDD